MIYGPKRMDPTKRIKAGTFDISLSPKKNQPPHKFKGLQSDDFLKTLNANKSRMTSLNTTPERGHYFSINNQNDSQKLSMLEEDNESSVKESQSIS